MLLGFGFQRHRRSTGELLLLIGHIGCRHYLVEYCQWFHCHIGFCHHIEFVCDFKGGAEVSWDQSGQILEAGWKCSCPLLGGKCV